MHRFAEGCDPRAPGGSRDNGGVPADAVALLTRDPVQAAAVLLSGGLVGLPTETVYGLAACADDVRAVARVFAVKARPADHPLIVHVRGLGDLPAWATAIPDYATRLAAAFWPGPLTLVLPRSARAGDHVTGGQDSVGVRAPAHPLAQRVLDAVAPRSLGGVPGLAAPSANRFGRVSPTSAQHVLAELGPYLDPGRDAVLDGGVSAVGVESTILDCTGPAPSLLRPGGVSAAEVEDVGGVRLAHRPSAVRAPGTLTAHYAPHARVVLADEADLAAALGPVSPATATTGLLAPAAVATPASVVRLAAPRTAPEYARCLYQALREADALGLSLVVAVPPVPDGIGAAVTDRLRRAMASGGR